MTKPSRLPIQGTPIQIEIDGTTTTAYVGESVATVLMAQGQRIFTDESIYNYARTIFCGMGICHQCLVTLNEIRDVRACMTTIQPGMRINTGMTLDIEGTEETQ
ncbi:MAG: (2Fe-2S)-binding protein [Chloroflexota bacterium]